MMRGGNDMDVQEACEVLEALIERDAKTKVLNIKEFLALNKLLLEAQVKLGYKIPEKYL